MSLFLITFLFLYSTLHLYVFVKIHFAFRLVFIPNLFIVILMMVMILAPFAVRLSERAGYESFARFVAYTGYTWMGIIFLFFTASICIDIIRIIAHVTGLLLKRDLPFFTSACRLFFILPLAYALLVTIYGYREAQNISVERIVIKTPKIPVSTGTLTIAQISDVHLGLVVRDEKLRLITDVVKKVNPDILVSTGDLVDGQIDGLSRLIEDLREINPRYGKFAITGNHEFYAGIRESLQFTQQAGFRVLRGEALTVGGIINIAGVDDRAGLPFNHIEVPEKLLLSGLPQNLFTVLLKHIPVVDKNALDRFDLQLSGHTHKGQIFPFRFLTKLFFPMYTGYHRLSQRSHLYVSRGSGTWGPPIRFLAAPEVTIIELHHSPADTR